MRDDVCWRDVSEGKREGEKKGVFGKGDGEERISYILGDDKPR